MQHEEAWHSSGSAGPDTPRTSARHNSHHHCTSCRRPRHGSRTCSLPLRADNCYTVYYYFTSLRHTDGAMALLALPARRCARNTICFTSCAGNHMVCEEHHAPPQGNSQYFLLDCGKGRYEMNLLLLNPRNGRHLEHNGIVGVSVSTMAMSS